MTFLESQSWLRLVLKMERCKDRNNVTMGDFKFVGCATVEIELLDAVKDCFLT